VLCGWAKWEKRQGAGWAGGGGRLGQEKKEGFFIYEFVSRALREI